MNTRLSERGEETVKISVVIPVYNMEKYIGRCLKSVAASTFRDLEILCVDDGSEDDSVRIINAFAEQDPRIRLVSREHQCAGAARNAGILEAAGTYIHFLDADDSILPDAYEKLCRSIEESGADVCECLYTNVNAETGAVDSEPGFQAQDPQMPLTVAAGGLNAVSLLRGHVIPWNKLYRRKFLVENAILFDDLVCAEDRSFYYEVIFKAEKIVRIQDRLIRHYVNIGTSLDGSDIRLRNFDVEFRSFERIWSMAQEYPEEVRKEVLDSCISDSISYYYRSIGTEYEETIRKELFEYWNPYLPLLGAEIRHKNWYTLYMGLLADRLTGWRGFIVRFLYGQCREASARKGIAARLKANAFKVLLLPALYLWSGGRLGGFTFR